MLSSGLCDTEICPVTLNVELQLLTLNQKMMCGEYSCESRVHIEFGTKFKGQELISMTFHSFFFIS